MSNYQRDRLILRIVIVAIATMVIAELSLNIYAIWYG